MILLAEKEVAMIAGSTTSRELTKLLKKEFENNMSRTSWGGTGVLIGWNRFTPTKGNKIDVNEQGSAHGCHTCDARLENDTDQPWVGDHFPPTELKPFARLALDEVFGLKGGNMVNRKTQILRPQCHLCSNQQAAAIRRLNSTASTKDIVEYLKKSPLERAKWGKLIIGHGLVVKAGTFTSSSGRRVSVTEAKTIQILGVRDGCHSDIAHKVAGGRYHADHIWPQELCTSYMGKVLEKLGLQDYKPKDQELRPQCPRCSSSQGGKMKQIAGLALAYAEKEGIKNYKVASGPIKRTDEDRERTKRKRESEDFIEPEDSDD